MCIVVFGSMVSLFEEDVRYDAAGSYPINLNWILKWMLITCDIYAGVESITTDQWTKKVVVVGNVRPEFVLNRVQQDKPGAEYWSARHREY